MSNRNLPIADFQDQIVNAVKNNPVVVITAETGAGKSTQVPQYLLDEGYELIVTQPRRLAARTVAQRVAEERNEKLGNTVGFRTAVDRQDSPSTQCLFCTDGLALVRELMGQNKGILILDEVHEWNENMEVLVAWAKSQIGQGVDFKVVLMSATLEAENLAAYFNGAPVISVPGRLFPVKEQDPSRFLVEDVVKLAQAGRNVLVFQPGKREIQDTVSTLQAQQLDVEILPLHGQLSPDEQARCFRHYDRPKIVVATNVAQTSVTIADIDAVVDSGMERRIELVEGVEGLYLKPISLADATQRKGRAGRTKEGIYIDHCGVSDRPDFPVAEILRKRLDQTVLRLAIAGFDMEALEFFHQPSKSDIHDARQSLIRLGCMTADGSVTRIGRLVNRLPVSVQYARMLIEADRLGVVDDVLTIAAIMEMGGITVPPPSRSNPNRPDWRRMVSSESESDIMGQLEVWEMADSMTKDQMRESGIGMRSYFRAKDIRRQLARAIKRHFSFGSTGNREDILKAVCAGMVDHLYHSAGYGDYRNGDGVTRELGSASLVRGGKWLVGKPFDLQIMTRRGQRVLKLISLATRVDPTWLVEIAPHLVKTKTGLRPTYDVEKDVVVSVTETYFNGQKVSEDSVADGEHPEAATVFAQWLSRMDALPSVPEYAAGQELDSVLRSNAERQERARQLNIRTGEETFRHFSRDEISDRFVAALSGARRIIEVVRPEALKLPELNQEMVSTVLREQPDTVVLLESELSVEYRTSSYNGTVLKPRVKLSGEIIAEKPWRDLPDDGVKLPGGRVVEVYLSFGYSADIIDHDIPRLKEKIHTYLNQKQWDSWKDRPDIEMPGVSDENPVIPFVTTVYGQCVVSGEDLKAYGTLGVNPSRYYDADPFFMVKWYRDMDEAQSVADSSARKLADFQAAEKTKVAVKAAQAEAESAREELKELARSESFAALSDELRTEIYDKVRSYFPSSADDLEEYVAETRGLITRVQAEFDRIQTLRARREETLKALDELASQYPWPDAHVVVRENGDAAVNCGKSSKMGHFDVLPSLGERQYGPESLDRRGKVSSWQRIPVGERVTVEDYSGAGNLKSRMSFVVPSDLTPGVWAVTENGETFYPVVYWNDREILPDSVAAVSVQTKSPSAESVDLSEVDLSQLFGGNVRSVQSI